MASLFSQYYKCNIIIHNAIYRYYSDWKYITEFERSKFEYTQSCYMLWYYNNIFAVIKFYAIQHNPCLLEENFTYLITKCNVLQGLCVILQYCLCGYAVETKFVEHIQLVHTPLTDIFRQSILFCYLWQNDLIFSFDHKIITGEIVNLILRFPFLFLCNNQSFSLTLDGLFSSSTL